MSAPAAAMPLLARTKRKPRPVVALKPRRGKSYFSAGLWRLEEGQNKTHRERMGDAIWLFGWLVDRQTKEEGSTGLVLGGAPLSHRVIADDMGASSHMTKRWLGRLVEEGYVEVLYTTYKHMIIYILNAKKFRRGQGVLHLDFAGGIRRMECDLLVRNLRHPRIERRKGERNDDGQYRKSGEGRAADTLRVADAVIRNLRAEAI